MPGTALACRSEAKIGFARRGGAPLAAILLALFVSAACSSPAPSAPPAFGPGYSAAIGSYRAQFEVLKTRAQAAIGSDLDSQLAVFVRMTDVTDTAVTALRRLRAPARIKHTFARLIEIMSSQAAVLRQIQNSARKGDQPGLDASLRAYATDLATGTSLQQQIERSVAATAAHR